MEDSRRTLESFNTCHDIHLKLHKRGTQIYIARSYCGTGLPLRFGLQGVDGATGLPGEENGEGVVNVFDKGKVQAFCMFK